MRFGSANFESAVRSNTRYIKIKAEVLSGNPLNPTITEMTGYTVSGSINRDASSVVRDSGSIEFTFVTLDSASKFTPVVPSALLAPFGNELRLSWGIDTGNGNFEFLPLGVFTLSNPQSDAHHGSGASTALTFYDRAKKIQRSRLTAPFTITNGASLANTLQQLLASRFGGLVTNFSGMADTLGDIIIPEQSDPWQEAVNIAVSRGYYLFFNTDGVCTLKAYPVLSSYTPVFAFTHGDAAANVTEAQFGLDSEEVYNHIIATSDDGQFRGEAWDADPSSPTYIGGRMGDVPMWYSSPYFTSNAQCQSTAAALLVKSKAPANTINMTARAHPGIEPYDVVSVKIPSLGINGNYFVVSCTHPVGIGLSSFTLSGV